MGFCRRPVDTHGLLEGSEQFLWRERLAQVQIRVRSKHLEVFPQIGTLTRSDLRPTLLVVRVSKLRQSADDRYRHAPPKQRVCNLTTR